MINGKEKGDFRKDLDENYFWNQLKNNDKAGLEGLYAMFAYELLAFGLSVKPHRSLVKDCIQELFIDIWKYRNNSNKIKNVKMYLFRSLANKIKKEIASEKKRHFKEQAEGFDSLYAEGDTEVGGSGIINIEKANLKLSVAMNNLPQRQKEIIYYVFFENLSHDQIALIMGIKVQSVYTLTWKAICNLRKNFILLLFLEIIKIF